MSIQTGNLNTQRKHKNHLGCATCLSNIEDKFNPLSDIYESITDLIRHYCDKEFALICFADEDDIWVRACSSQQHIDMTKRPLEDSFCFHCLELEKTLEVPDARTNTLFKNHILTVQAPYFRYYLGVPIYIDEGSPVGTLCLYDTHPGHSTDQQIACLERVAGFLGTLMKNTLYSDSNTDSVLRANRLNLVNLFSSSLIHELSQPLTAINQYHTTLCNLICDIPQVSDDMVQLCDDTRRQIERVHNVVHAHRRFIRGGSSNVVRIQPDTLIKDALELIELEILNQRISLKKSIQADLPVVECDMVLIQQVLINLLMNSIRATSKQKSRRVVSIECATYQGDMIAFTISDNGPGMKQDLFDQLMMSLPVNKPDGTGLGLIICKHIIDHHAGYIRYIPSENGTSLQFSLPA